MTDEQRRRERRFWAPDVRRDVDDEVAYHLEMRERDFAARGLSPAEAREAALRKFGDPDRVATTCRDIDERRYRKERRASMWTDFRQDVTFGVRLLGRSPGFTAVAVLPYPDPHQLRPESGRWCWSSARPRHVPISSGSCGRLRRRRARA